MFKHKQDISDKAKFANEVCKLLLYKYEGSISDAAHNAGDVYKYFKESLYEVVDTEVPLFWLHELLSSDPSDYYMTTERWDTEVTQAKIACVNYYLEPAKPETFDRRRSTLTGQVFDSGRRTGKSVRLIDNAIQIIFSGNICVVEDHPEPDKSKHADKALFKRIVKRLESEHGYMLHGGRFNLDEEALEISIKPR
jgi:hypothetical protein